MNSIELLTCWTTFLLVTAWLGTTGRRDPYWHTAPRYIVLDTGEQVAQGDDWADLAEAVGVLTDDRDAVDIKLWEEECSS